jgi:hypothetical protein
VCDWVRFSVGGVWGGRSCVPCCAWRARNGVHVVMFAQWAVVAAVYDVVSGVRGLCVCILHVSVRCALRGLWACVVLGDTRHDAAVPLCWVGLVSSHVSARACLWRDGSGERGASRHVRGGARWACENVKHLVCVIRAT